MGPNYYQYGPDYYNQMQAQINQQQQQLQHMQQMSQKTIVDFIQGEASADVFPVNPGQKVVLIDMDNPYVYEKERDANGVLVKHRYRLELDDEKEEPSGGLDLSGYVKSEDVAVMISEAIEKKLSEYNLKPSKKKGESDEPTV